ncbi:transposase [Neisseria meningitidis]|nr:transposase [Neisseria meningitidis]
MNINQDRASEAADSTNSTAGEATLYWFLLIHYSIGRTGFC